MGAGIPKRIPPKENQNFPDPMSKPLSVYVPFGALTQRVLKSVISVVCDRRGRYIVPGSERPLLCFLLAINKKLTELEKDEEGESNVHAQQVRQWLVDRKGKPLNWKELKDQFDQIYKVSKKDLDEYKLKEEKDFYHEMSLVPKLSHCRKSHKYMAQYRPNGFEPEELKVYWNYEQIEQLCRKPDEPHDPSDKNVIDNLRHHPLEKRNHSGKISYRTMGIEKVVFEVPESAQIILLNFANEESPGGGYLRHAMAQEEVLLYNSDGYRSLLDLKYGRMGGGYAIPEFGLAYVRDIRVVEEKSEKARKADMLVSACYCIDHEQLYENPQNHEEWYQNNLDKFRAFIAAAVANTIGDGSNTYLLLGPIGTGAFGNDTTEIGKVFRDVLNKPLLGMECAVRHAFENIWFVSTDGWKNDEFENVFAEAGTSTKSEVNPKKDPSPQVETKVEPTAHEQADLKPQVKPETQAEPEEKPKEDLKPTTETKVESEAQPMSQEEEKPRPEEGAPSETNPDAKPEPIDNVKAPEADKP